MPRPRRTRHPVPNSSHSENEEVPVTGSVVLDRVEFLTFSNEGDDDEPEEEEAHECGDEAEGTEQYETMNLVVRRGAPFEATAYLKRPLFSGEVLNLKLSTHIDGELSVGPTEREVLLNSPISNETNRDIRRWNFKVVKNDRDFIQVKIWSPVDVIVCRWKLTFIVKKAETLQEIDRHVCRKDIFVIFNAWNPDDEAYIEDESYRKEYILEDEGVIFVGSTHWNHARDWSFGQFESPVLEAAMYLLDNGDLYAWARKSPVFVSRALSAYVNAADDNGVIVGNWSGDYSGGTAPTTWTGSVEVLQEYMHYQKPVSYGQCWVFSAVTTSLLRALGLACRSVTNFDSAHDTDANLIKDVLFDQDMERINHNDSIWNFHVWNEVYMKRADLPAGYSGWQAIDATPQETSEGIFQIGPAPLMAIREGNVYLPYDCKFVFAEVNSDEVHWQQQKDGSWKVLKVYTDTVGGLVLTKSIGSDQKDDITHLYKPKEGSVAERLAVKNAVRFGTNPDFHLRVPPAKAEDVTLKIHARDALNLIADEFSYNIEIGNTSNEERTVTSKVIAKKVQYTGTCAKVLDQQIFKEEKITGQSDKKKEVMFKLGDDLINTNDDSSIKIQVVSKVHETGQVIFQALVVSIEPPPLVIEVSSKYVRQGETIEVTFKIPNPFNRDLTCAFFEISGAGLVKPTKLFVGKVAANKTAGTSTSITVPRRGKRWRRLVATFSCRQFEGSRSMVWIRVRRKRRNYWWWRD